MILNQGVLSQRRSAVCTEQAHAPEPRSLLCTFGVGPTLGEIENLNACAPASVQATRGSALSAATDDISWSQTSDEQRQGCQVPLREVRLPRTASQEIQKEADCTHVTAKSLNESKAAAQR